MAASAGGDGSLVPVGHLTSDGYSTTVSLPFQFCYYGQFYDVITVSSNGWLAMGEEDFVFFRNRNIPSGVGPAAMIAPFWDEMSEGEIYTSYDADDHYLVIEWFEFRDVTHAYNQTFQVILYDPEYFPTATGDGEIKFQYQDIHNTDQEENYATIGIENQAQTEGLLLGYANMCPETVHEIESETAIFFTIDEGAPIPQMDVTQEQIILRLPPDTTITCEFEIENLNADVELRYEMSVSHFPQRDLEESGGRDISGDSINPVNTLYYTSHEMNLYAFMVHDPVDNEAIHGVSISFPEYVQVTRATDIGELNYNGETGYGAQASWGYGNGPDYATSSPLVFHVYFIVDAGISSPIPINWQIDGDGTGAVPHQASGTITLMPSSETYIWVEYPNGGEELAFGVTDTIRWASYGDIPAVDIYYTTNNFVNYQVIGNDIENDGTMEWTVPYELTSSARIRVREANGNEYDDSDANFDIRGLVISSPQDGDILAYGSYEEIVWDFTGGALTADIELSVNGGYTWLPLANDIPNSGSYGFIVDYQPSDNCKIRITTSDGLISGVMTGAFIITDSPVNWMTISQPEGILQPEETRTCQLQIDTSGLGHGRYQAYLTITTNYNQHIILPISLEIINLGNDESQITEPELLSSNFPNPFQGTATRGNGTMINFHLNKASEVKLAAYNIKGQQVRVFIDEKRGTGDYGINWDGTDQTGYPLASGVYFYQLQIDGRLMATKKCLLLK
jgi:hypothetical protein